MAATDAKAVYWNRRYEPAIEARDASIKQALRADGIDARSHNGALLFEPRDLQTKQGDPYRVFTPFWKAVRGRTIAAAAPAPKASMALTPSIAHPVGVKYATRRMKGPTSSSGHHNPPSGASRSGRHSGA